MDACDKKKLERKLHVKLYIDIVYPEVNFRDSVYNLSIIYRCSESTIERDYYNSPHIAVTGINETN